MGRVSHQALWGYYTDPRGLIHGAGLPQLHLKMYKH